jgi:hypothetical protein
MRNPIRTSLCINGAAWSRPSDPRAQPSTYLGYPGQEGVGAYFEAGDAFPFADVLVVGFGPRTDELALKHLAVAFDVMVRGVRDLSSRAGGEVLLPR